MNFLSDYIGCTAEDQRLSKECKVIGLKGTRYNDKCINHKIQITSQSITEKIIESSFHSIDNSN